MLSSRHEEQRAWIKENNTSLRAFFPAIKSGVATMSLPLFFDLCQPRRLVDTGKFREKRYLKFWTPKGIWEEQPNSNKSLSDLGSSSKIVGTAKNLPIKDDI